MDMRASQIESDLAAVLADASRLRPEDVLATAKQLDATMRAAYRHLPVGTVDGGLETLPSDRDYSPALVLWG